MPENVYFRDPRHPDEVHGPFTVLELKKCALRGELRPAYQVSVDRKAWMGADEFEPELFDGESSDRGDTLAGTVQEGAGKGVQFLKDRGLAYWKFARAAAKFYWANRRTLSQLLTDYVPFFREQGNRREIRVSRDDNHEKVSFDGEQWKVELPDCCVVCGEPADRDWNSEQRSVPNLTWPLLAPLNGLLAGFLLFFFFYSSSWSKYLLLLGPCIGFLVGYRLRGETLVTVRFRRCREHIKRSRIPRIRTFRNLLVIGVGDRSVWRQFHYGDSGVKTPIAVPPPFVEGSIVPPDVVEKPSAPPRTIKLAGDDEEETPNS